MTTGRSKTKKSFKIKLRQLGNIDTFTFNRPYSNYAYLCFNIWNRFIISDNSGSGFRNIFRDLKNKNKLFDTNPMRHFAGLLVTASVCKYYNCNKLSLHTFCRIF